ncbi:hypothetical protein [Vulgatibacter sp.]|uniref:hypothetical protein n=1 Tax=Vulgatibacter sp. TaxID=1971226 RepID=UPI0035659C64
MAELPLPQQGEEAIELELCAEVPDHIWTEHDHWERLQLLARLSSPSDEGYAGDAPTTVDEVRRATLAAVHRFKDARDRIEREVFLAASLFSTAARASLADEIRTGAEGALGELERERTELAAGSGSDAGELVRERILAAEFLSNHALEFISKVQRAVDEQLCGPRSRHRAEYAEAAAQLRPFLAERLAQELAYRSERGFLQPDDSDPWQLERYVARASLLKKHFQEVLFLQLETERSEQRFRNWFGVVAASLAALWAFPLGFLLTGGSGVTGLGLGVSSTIALLVLSYAVKDRIKESVRSWLSSRVEAGYAGRITSLTAPARLLGTPLRLMRVRESFFATREQRPDPLNPDLGPTRPVVRLRYLLRGTVESDARLAWHGHERAKLVFRYDLSPLFTRLDDPIKQVPVLAEGGRMLRFAEAARCYRMPVRLSLRHRGMVQEQSGVLVTHKLGLERIERPVVPAGNDAIPAGPGPLASIPWGLRRR